MGLLDGKVAIVTGAGHGIGSGEALELAKEGAKVVVNDLGGDTHGVGEDRAPAQQVVDEIEAMGGEAVAHTESCSDFEAAGRLVQLAIDTFGDLHVVVNNAGILRDKMLVNMTDAEWDAVMNVHLRGHFCPTRHAAAYWREQVKAGKDVKAAIVNTSSGAGLLGNVGQTNYGAAKAGIAAFTIIAARELRRYGVTVNAISPTALTRMTEGLRQLTPEEAAIRAPKWVSPTVVYLASEEAQDITGRVIQAGMGRIGVCEGWRRGAEVPQVADPAEAGSLVREMIAKVRKNSGMDGLELD